MYGTSIFSYFSFFERGTVIDIIFATFRLLNMALKAHILQVFPEIWP